MKNEVARPKVILDGKQAEQELENLTAKAKKFRDAMMEAAAAGDPQKEKRFQQQLKATTTEIRNLKKEAFDVDRVLKNINGASFNELSQAVRKATNDLKKMQQTDPGYQAQQQKVVALKTKLGELSNEQKVHEPLWSRMANGANKYFSVITAGAASLAGLILGMKQVVQSFNDYEERVDNLSALTGLAGENLDWLSQKAKDLSTSTLEGNIRVKQSAQDIVDAFTKTGSARPELLKNKEALAETTQEAIILANAAKTELYPAIEALTMVMNQYNVPASEARRIINVLAAGSKEGAGEIPYLTTAFEKAGTVASLAGISIETLGATIETLAPRITQPEIAGRSLKGVLIDMQTGADDTNPAIVGLSTALENLGKKNLSVTELTKKFGTENIATIQILLTNIEELKRYEKAMTGTNVAIEQAAINTDNNNAKLAQAKNRINVISIALGEKLAPAMTLVTGYFGKSLAVLSYLVDVFIKYSGLIFTSTAAIVGYTVAIELATLWETRSNAEKGIGLALTKLKVFWHGVERGALLLSAAAQALMTGNTTRATAAMRLFNIETKMNPIGLLVGIIAAAVVALAMYSRGLTAAQQAQKAVNDVNIEAQKAMVEEKVKVEQLLKIAKNKNLSDETRLKALKDLNEISPEYYGNLTLETINTKAADDATKNYIESIKKKAKAQAGFQKLVDIEKELIDLQNGKGAESTFWQDTWNMATSAGNAAVYAGKSVNTALSNIDEKTKALIETKKKLTEQMDNENKTPASTDSGKNPGGDDKAAQDLIKLKEKELQDINEEIAATPALIAARNQRAEAKQKEIDALKELGTTKGKKEDDKSKDAAYKALEIANRKELNLIKQYQIEVNATEEEYNKALEEEEINALNKKLALQIKYGDDYSDTMAAILDKQLKIQNDIDKKTDDEKKKSLKKELDDLDNQQKNELALLKKGALAKGLSEEETNALLITKEIEFLNQKLILEKKYGQDTVETTAAITSKINELAENAVKGDEDRAKELADLKKKYLDEEVLAKEEKVNDLAALDKLYQDGAISSYEEYQRLKTEINKKYEQSRLDKAIEFGQKAQQFISLGSNLVQTLMDAELAKAGDNEEKKAQIKKKYANAQFLMAASEIVVNTAVAIMQGFAQLGPIGGAIAAVLLGATGAAQLSIANSERQKIMGSKQSGGYANFDGAENEVDGVYHKKEFIASAPAVRNPTVKPILDIINLAQKNGTIAQLNLPTVLAATGSLPNGRQSGGFASEIIPTGSPTTPISPSAYATRDPELTAALNNMSRAVALLVKNGVQFPIVPFKKQLDEVSDLINQTGMRGFKK